MKKGETMRLTQKQKLELHRLMSLGDDQLKWARVKKLDYGYNVEHLENPSKVKAFIPISTKWFKTFKKAWQYLTVYEENNPKRACLLYSYGAKVLEENPSLNYGEYRI